MLRIPTSPELHNPKNSEVPLSAGEFEAPLVERPVELLGSPSHSALASFFAPALSDLPEIPAPLP
jgi:hypothetical protein